MTPKIIEELLKKTSNHYIVYLFENELILGEYNHIIRQIMPISFVVKDKGIWSGEWFVNEYKEKGITPLFLYEKFTEVDIQEIREKLPEYWI